MEGNRKLKKTVIGKTELRELSRQNLIDSVSYRNVSLLLSLGADSLYQEMVPIGKICRFLVKRICRTSDVKRNRKRAIAFLRFVAPSVLLEDFPESEKTVVIGFNHPSLGEIFRLMYLGLEAYPDRDFFFPVNIPWFENLSPVIPLLEANGVYLTPMITPSTQKKLEKQFENDEDALEMVKHYKSAFEKEYMIASKSMAERKAVIVVAPSATRQATVFLNEEEKRGEGHIHPTMTLLARSILRSDESEAVFVPVVVFEPEDNNRKLNLFKPYRIEPCKPFETEEIKELTEGRKRDFDYQFLLRIDEKYTK